MAREATECAHCGAMVLPQDQVFFEQGGTAMVLCEACTDKMLSGPNVTYRTIDSD